MRRVRRPARAGPAPGATTRPSRTSSAGADPLRDRRPAAARRAARPRSPTPGLRRQAAEHRGGLVRGDGSRGSQQEAGAAPLGHQPRQQPERPDPGERQAARRLGLASAADEADRTEPELGTPLQLDGELAGRWRRRRARGPGGPAGRPAAVSGSRRTSRHARRGARPAPPPPRAMLRSDAPTTPAATIRAGRSLRASSTSRGRCSPAAQPTHGGQRARREQAGPGRVASERPRQQPDQRRTAATSSERQRRPRGAEPRHPLGARLQPQTPPRTSAFGAPPSERAVRGHPTADHRSLVHGPRRERSGAPFDRSRERSRGDPGPASRRRARLRRARPGLGGVRRPAAAAGPASWPRSGVWWSTETRGYGYCSLVVPVRQRRASPAMLKLAFPDDESEHEALGLQRWAGTGRCPAARRRPAPPRAAARTAARRPTSTRSDGVEACEVVAGLYGGSTSRHRRSCAPLTSYVGAWTDSSPALPRDAPDPAPAGRAGAVAGAATWSSTTASGGDADPRRPALRERAGRRPRAVAGHRPQADERRPALRAGADAVEPLGGGRRPGDVRAAVRRRFHTLVDAAGLDEDRARDWVVVRMVHNAMWELEDHPQRRPTTTG